MACNIQAPENYCKCYFQENPRKYNFFSGAKMAKEGKKRGPKTDRLKLDDKSWETALKKAVRKKKPKDGWPKKGKKSRKP